jgi:hypothetical protein
MKKLIAGIVAVFFLQAMFIVYHATNPLPDSDSITYSGRDSNEPMTAKLLDQMSSEAEFADDIRPDGIASEQAFRSHALYTRASLEPANHRQFRTARSVARRNRMVRQNLTAGMGSSARVIFSNEYAAVVVTTVGTSRH